MTDFELGWVVGFLEGEGCFACWVQKTGTPHTGGSRSLSVICDQVQKEPLDRLMRFTGAGKVLGPYTTNKPDGNNRQPIHSWRAHTAAASQLMETIRPHMSPRRQAQIDKALSLWKARPKLDAHARSLKAAITLRGRKGRDDRQLHLLGGGIKP